MKKQRLIYSLIISVVILSLFLASALPVSASTQTIEFKGKDLYDLLKRDDTILSVRDTESSDDPGAWESFTESDNGYFNDYFQMVMDYSGDNVYIYFTAMSFAKGKDIRLTFRSLFNGKTYPYVVDFNTTVYKRYWFDNGDYSYYDGDYGSYMRCSLMSVTTMDWYSQKIFCSGTSAPGLVDVDYPFLNNVTLGDRTVVDSSNPFLTNDPSSKHYQNYLSYPSFPCDFSYDAYAYTGQEYDSISGFQIEYRNGDLPYEAGAVAFCITPVTMTVVNNEWIEEWGWIKNMTDNELKNYLTSLDKADISKDFLENNSSTLNGYNDFVDSNQDRPNIDMNYLLNLENIGSLSSGIASFAAGSAPLFQDSAFFNIFPIIAAPPLVISYLLFGKKG